MLLTLLLYGLVLRPLAFAQAPLALEAIFVLSAAFAMAELFWLGFSWTEIQGAIIHRLGRALPAIFILFAIGLLVGAWIISGTIPMLVAWGVTLVSPSWIYPLAFLIPVLFSLLTGTSWGSAGTIGVVLMGIGLSVGADPAVLAGAIIGGAYFGDKLSPLSDTTNIAAIATEVPLFSHIRAMLWTTLPAAGLALAVYTALGLLDPPAPATDLAAPEAFAAALGGLFTFHPVLLLPPLIVLAGAWRGAPTLPLLLLSIVVATGLALLLQPFDAAQVTAALKNGYRLSFSEVSGPLPEGIAVLLERGGLYSMSEAIFIAMLVFLFVGAIDLLDTMPRLVNRAFAFAKKPAALVLSALGATAVTNAMTSNQS
ncbi:MAG: Na+/H+ antiporter NhaC family protein, partial [Pseudomonadales bacterium]